MLDYKTAGELTGGLCFSALTSELGDLVELLFAAAGVPLAAE